MSNNYSFGDTPNWESPELVARWKKFSLDERAEKLGQLIQAGRELMIEGIKLRNPGITNEAAREKLKELLYQSYQIKND